MCLTLNDVIAGTLLAPGTMLDGLTRLLETLCLLPRKGFSRTQERYARGTLRRCIRSEFGSNYSMSADMRVHIPMIDPVDRYQSA